MRPCLLLIDLQRDFLTRPGLMPDAGNLIRQVSALLEDWRGLSLPVIHVHTLVSADGHDRMPHWKRRDHWACVAGSPGAQPPAALAPLPSEPVVGKQYYSAFNHPDLLASLRAQNIDTLIVAGIYTHSCVRSTVMDGYQNGFRLWVVSDCVGSDSPLHDDLTRAYLAERACQFLTASEILARFRRQRDAMEISVAGEKLPSLYLGNAWRESRSATPWTHYSPSNRLEALATFNLGNADDVSLAAGRAVRALPYWNSLSLKERTGILDAWGREIEARREEFLVLTGLEIGKPLGEARSEFDYALALLRACLNRAYHEHAEFVGRGIGVRHRPLGCVGLITPWNNPLAIPVGKLAPALMFGNTVVWKPALPTSRIVALVMDTLKVAGLPGDIVNVVLGGADTARALVFDRHIAAISFTGATATGRRMAALCADRGIPLQAELGGNNGVIITSHCDVGRVATVLARSVFSFSGQRCTAPRRLIIERPVLRDFIDDFIEQTLALRIGFPQDALTQIGPLVSTERCEIMAAVVADSLDAGGTLLCGGGVPAGFEAGCWFEPTVIAPAGRQDLIVQEESFGPIGVILPADDFDDALRQCNDVPHGLIATLCSDDPAQQNRFMQDAAAGILRIGAEQMAIHPDAPFGGWKASGLGPPEHGRWDMAFYTRPQAVYGLGNTSNLPQ